MTTIYVAGPMTYHPQFNFPEFIKMGAYLRSLGFDVVSPAELDSPEDRAAAMASPDGAPIHYTYGKTHADFLARDLKIIADKVDTILVLPGWEKSTGARIETFLGFAYGKPIIRDVPGHPFQTVPRIELFRAWSQEPELSIHASYEVPA